MLLDEIDWTLEPRQQYAILGQQGSGKTTLLEILSGAKLPTTGWVDRRAIVSSTIALLRYSTLFSTPRQLIKRLSKVYQVDDRNLFEFVEAFSELEGTMDSPIRVLSKGARQRLAVGLFYGVPCDYYLFDERASTRNARVKAKAMEVQLQRRQNSGMVLVTTNTRAALAFGGIGGVLFRGKLSFYASLEEAVAVFERIQAEYPVLSIEDQTRHRLQDEREDEGDFF